MKNKTQQEAQAALQYIFNHIDFRRLGSIKHGKITDAGETLRTFINQNKPKEIAGDREEALSYFNAERFFKGHRPTSFCYGRDRGSDRRNSPFSTS